MKLTRRTLLGGIAITGASAATGAGTFAYLQDDEQTGMTVNVGTLSLDNTEEFSLSEDPETEGEDTFEQEITIVNDGSLPVRQVLLTDVSVSDQTLAAALRILDLRYGRESSREDRTEIRSDVESIVSGSGNGNGVLDLDDLGRYLDGGAIRLEELVDEDDGEGAVLHAGEEAYLDVVAEWDYERIPSEYNGGSLTGNITVEGRQQEPE